MKGSTDQISKVFIQMVLVLIVIVWASNPLYASIETAKQNSARLNALEIKGVIDIMKSSPSDMTYILKLPSLKCKIKISKDSVDFYLLVADKDNKFVSHFVQSDVDVIPERDEFDCSEKSILLRKREKEIRIG